MEEIPTVVFTRGESILTDSQMNFNISWSILLFTMHSCMGNTYRMVSRDSTKHLSLKPHVQIVHMVLHFSFISSGISLHRRLCR